MKDYKKYYDIPAKPEEVYMALTNSDTIYMWTGEVAEMKPIPGTEFSMWEGSIVGKNIEFEENKKIVQEWYFGEESEVPSIVTIKLHIAPKVTSVELTHTNIPDHDYNDFVEGWDDTYFGSLKDFFLEMME
jgi:activator of HSP90 ATPase